MMRAAGCEIYLKEVSRKCVSFSSTGCVPPLCPTLSQPQCSLLVLVAVDVLFSEDVYQVRLVFLGMTLNPGRLHLASCFVVSTISFISLLHDQASKHHFHLLPLSLLHTHTHTHALSPSLYPPLSLISLSLSPSSLSTSSLSLPPITQYHVDDYITITILLLILMILQVVTSKLL